MARHNFREILVWQKSMNLVKEVYGHTVDFPSEEKFGITSQLKRAVVSIAANISEGAGRGTDKDFARFLDMSEGSCNECITLIILSKELSFLKNDSAEALINEIQEITRMIHGFKRKLTNN